MDIDYDLNGLYNIKKPSQLINDLNLKWKRRIMRLTGIYCVLVNRKRLIVLTILCNIIEQSYECRTP